jgi:hypothetical protein
MKQLLERFNACQEARDWVGDKTLEEAWNTCHRGDWMLWLYKRMYPDNLRELTLAKGHCVNTVRHLMKDNRSLKAVDAAIAFGEGKINRADAAAYVVAAYAAVYAAADAAYAASAAYAAYAAVDNVDAAYATAAAYADDDARKENQQMTADICRQYLKIV